jgi:chemotaxis protein methyltransferase CheR
MSESEFRMFAELLREHAGLNFTQDNRFLLEKRVCRRMEEMTCQTHAAYLFELRNDGGSESELSRLIDDVTTNETYFFRERRQLDALIDEILPELLATRASRDGRPARIWSAGCASGEEPYSIVMLAREAGIDVGNELRVHGSDISRRMLRRARGGVYRDASFRETEPELRDRYFEERDGSWRIRDDVRRGVDFLHLNLLDRRRVALLGPMDVIICRNVIIYFDIEGKRRTIGTFEQKLRPGGHLLLGHSESLLNLSTSLTLRHLREDTVYRRPALGWEPSPDERDAEAAG